MVTKKAATAASQYGHSQSEEKIGLGDKYHRSIKVHTVLFWRVFKSRNNLIYTVEMGTTVIYGWFWGFAKSLYCRGVLKGEDRDSETRVVD